MIRFRLKELIAEKEFRERRVITMTEVAAQTGINRMTLSKIANHPGYSHCLLHNSSSIPGLNEG